MVDEYSLIVGSVKLYINYGTTGDSSTGRISYVDPYTTLTGFRLGYDWNEQSIGYSIQANQKDVYVYASGQLDYYITVGTDIKFYSEHVNLGRTCYLIR